MKKLYNATNNMLPSLLYLQESYTYFSNPHCTCTGFYYVFSVVLLRTELYLKSLNDILNSFLVENDYLKYT